MSDRRERTQENAAAMRDRCAELEERHERRACDFGDPICINTDQIYDSCKDRDCIKDRRVYFTNAGQEIVDRAINVKIKNAEIIWIYTTVEPVPFNRGFFTVDMKFFIKVTVETFRGVSCPVELEGLTTFDKKVILFGSEGNVKIFESAATACEDITELWQKNNLPKAVVEAVDPIALSAKIVSHDDCCCCECSDYPAIPENICACFDDELYVGDEGKTVLATLGLFTIVRLERNAQLLIDAVDFCIPDKECPAATENNPCELFNSIGFPFNEFFPPQRGGSGDDTPNCGCGCGCGN